MSARRRRWRRAALALAPLAAWLLRALAVTWRPQRLGPEPFGTGLHLAAVWHRSALVAAGLFRDRGLHVPVSRSGDGDIAVAVLRSLGFGDSPRGSSGRGGVAMAHASVRLLRAGGIVAMLPDGPLGPAGQVKPGVIALAGLSREPILPVAFAARPCLRFGSWDRMVLPLPFARVAVAVGEPLAVDAARGDAAREACRRRLEEQLEAQSARAEALLARAAPRA